jgi:YegS/Rv2252/BmrU family lipid kinase
MNEKKSVLVIINPIAGTSPKNQIPSILAKRLNPAQYTVDIQFSEYKGHAGVLAKQAVDNRYHYVLAVGGDGTVNEIARNLVHTDTALAIIPSGSGNGLARHLGISLQISKAVDVFLAENVTPVDYCKANDTFFFCTFGVGLDAKVSQAFSQRKTRGLHSYLTGAITEFAKLKPESYKITPENEKMFLQKALFITCANASQWGYNVYVAPTASVQDGLLDMVILLPFPIYDAAPLGVQLLTKNLDKSNYVKVIKTRHVTIEREKEGVAHVDGEPIFMGKKIEINNIRGGLKALVPRKI